MWIGGAAPLPLLLRRAEIEQSWIACIHRSRLSVTVAANTFDDARYISDSLTIWHERRQSHVQPLLLEYYEGRGHRSVLRLKWWLHTWWYASCETLGVCMGWGGHKVQHWVDKWLGVSCQVGFVQRQWVMHKWWKSVLNVCSVVVGLMFSRGPVQTG